MGQGAVWASVGVLVDESIEEGLELRGCARLSRLGA